MNSPFQRASFIARQKDLRQRILEAKSTNDSSLIDWLEAQWVHRYGVTTLPNSLKVQKLIQSSSDGHVENEKNLDKTTIISLDNSIQNKNLGSSFEGKVDSDSIRDLNQGVKISPIESKEDKIRRISPPPTPTLSHLRRWLPRNSNDIPNAS